MAQNKSKTPQELYNALCAHVEKMHSQEALLLIEKAYNLAIDAHKEQKRKSGEPYIIHPLEVTLILAELNSDIETLVAGLLHDVIEDSKYSYEDIAGEFGEEVAKLVDGVTKLLQIKYSKDETSKKQHMLAENYRKMFIAMAQDIRIIIIKIADRLHNMRTLDYMTEEKRKLKSQETVDIYASIALRLGMAAIRSELEDLAFKYLEPERYHMLAEKLNKKQTERQAMVEKMVEGISAKMKEVGIDCVVEGRPKHLYSIHKKLKKKDKEWEDIYDLFAVRVLTNTKAECWAVLSEVHEIYTPIQARFKDYISVPKSNNYQSLHTTVVGVDGEPFEIQIKTHEMHEVAEYGVAAHWKYKEGGSRKTNANEEMVFGGVKRLLTVQKELSQETDDTVFLDELKAELDTYGNSIFCYTPKGDVHELRKGSTAVDFAYSVHSAVGNTMVAAKVNSHIVTFDYVLKTGDIIEIETSRSSSGPKADWLNFVKTGAARSRIKSFLKKENKALDHVEGKKILEEEAARRKISLQELLTKERQEFILGKYNFMDWDDFLAAIGRRSIREEQVIKRLLAEKTKEEERKRKLELQNTKIEDIDIDKLVKKVDDKGAKQKAKKVKSGVIVQGIGDTDVRFSGCCTPLHGDDIIGFITRGRGVSVHRKDCKNVENFYATDEKRIINVGWDKAQKHTKYAVHLKIETEPTSTLIMQISSLLSEMRIDVKDFNVKNTSNSATFDITVMIDSKEQLEYLTTRVSGVKGVHNIIRVI